MGSIQSTPRNILVTGGARGIGRAIVERFLAGGDHVIIADNLPLPETNLGRKELSYYRVDLIETENNTPTEEDKCWLADNVSLGRAGRIEEIAEVVWFLAGDFASYITGQAFIVDGGMT